MGRVGLIMGGLALVVVALSSLIPLLGAFVIAPLSAILIGAGAGWWASKVMGYGTAGRGAGAGAITGLGALIGSGIGIVLLVVLSTNNPQAQQQIQQIIRDAQAQNPDAQLPDTTQIGPLVTVVGGIGGFCLGIVDLILATLAGLIAALIYGRNRGPVAASIPGTYSVPPMNEAAPPLAQPAMPIEPIAPTEPETYSRPSMGWMSAAVTQQTPAVDEPSATAASTSETGSVDRTTQELHDPEHHARIYPDDDRRES